MRGAARRRGLGAARARGLPLAKGERCQIHELALPYLNARLLRHLLGRHAHEGALAVHHARGYFKKVAPHGQPRLAAAHDPALARAVQHGQDGHGAAARKDDAGHGAALEGARRKELYKAHARPEKVHRLEANGLQREARVEVAQPGGKGGRGERGGNVNRRRLRHCRNRDGGAVDGYGGGRRGHGAQRSLREPHAGPNSFVLLPIF